MFVLCFTAMVLSGNWSMQAHAADAKATSSAVAAPRSKSGETVSGSAAYDLLLFYGQSNMVGEASHSPTYFGSAADEILDAANSTGIDQDIIGNTSDCATTYVPLQKGTAWWYSLTDQTLYEVKPQQPIGTSVGGFTAVIYDEQSRQWKSIDSLTNVSAAQWYSDQINMIPEFAASWYQKTGHKVIAIDCAVGGVPIQAFLPKSDPDYKAPDAGSIVQYDNLYEGVVDSVNGALAAAAQRGWQVTGRYFVSFQGEGNLYDTNYMKDYEKVASYWRQLGFTKGALVQTSFTNNIASGYAGVMQMHNWQKALVAQDNDLILGSSFSFDHYVPDAANYNTYWKKKWKGMSWNNACIMSRLVVDSDIHDLIHLNSAALSQIGRETAVNLAQSLR